MTKEESKVLTDLQVFIMNSKSITAEEADTALDIIASYIKSKK